MMPRQKKENQPLSLRMELNTYKRLAAYCEKVGQAKTVAIERAINKYIDEYEEKEKVVNSYVKRTHYD